MNEKRIIRLAVVFMMLVGVLLGRLFQIQVVEHDEWVKEARRSRSHVRSIPFKRGAIFDVRGRSLAEDRRSADLMFEYRAFRRSHPAGQVLEALSLLGGAPGGLEHCWSEIDRLVPRLLSVSAETIRELSPRAQGDLLFYLRGLSGWSDSASAKEAQTWVKEGEGTYLNRFPRSLAASEQLVVEARLHWADLEQYVPRVMQRLEKERRNLEWWVRQRALREAAGRGFGLTAYQVYRELVEEPDSALALASKIVDRWDLGESSESAHEVRDLLTTVPASEERDRQSQFDTFGRILRTIEDRSKDDLIGARRRVIRDVHGNRVVRLSKDLEYELIDLLARQPDDFPGLYPEENPKRDYPDETAIHLVGRLRSPSAEEVLRYRELQADYKFLQQKLSRSPSEERSLLDLKDQLRRTALRPDEVTGASGYEWSFRQELAGERGYLEALDSVELRQHELGFRPARDGKDLRLACDIRLMESAQDAIRTGYRIARHRLRKAGGTAEQLGFLKTEKTGIALIDLRDGSIPVLATLPTYSGAEFRSEYAALARDVEHAPLRHRALAGGGSGAQVPYPGSTFKLLVAMEALRQDAGWWARTLKCERVYRPFGPEGKALHCEGMHGDIVMKDAIRHSCNVFFYKLGELLGYSSIHKRAVEMGFGAPLAQALTGKQENHQWQLAGPNRILEMGGNWLRDPTTARGRMAPMHLAIGQAHISSSPLQMARFFGWLAVGKLWEPSLVASLGDHRMVSEFVEPPFDDLSRQRLGVALKEVVQHPAGTAFDEEHDLSEWDVAGKTGTAQVGIQANGRPIPKHAWFAGYFPAESPRYAVAVLCENSDLHGGEIATIILHEFLSREAEALLQ